MTTTNDTCLFICGTRIDLPLTESPNTRSSLQEAALGRLSKTQKPTWKRFPDPIILPNGHIAMVAVQIETYEDPSSLPDFMQADVNRALATFKAGQASNTK